MNSDFHKENRAGLYPSLPADSLLLLFSGSMLRKTGDEDYPFFADRSFVYFTGIEQQDCILAVLKDRSTVREILFLAAPDAMEERWRGRRLKPEEAQELSGITDIRTLPEFDSFLAGKLSAGLTVCMDFDRKKEEEQPIRSAYLMAQRIRHNAPHIILNNVHPKIRALRTIKKPCEIQAMRKAQTITRDGILAMMRASRDGMYEYQYKAEFDYALAQRGVLSPGFPSIISAGKNNFCIHYYAYRGQAHDGDMVLNDVGACWDNEINDVSRGWPVNGSFSEKQRLLYTCAFNTSNHMFDILRPGLPMSFVDQEIRRFNFGQLKETGVCSRFEDVGTYMWHGGAHHVGYDVHDEVDVADGKRLLEPGMVFCVDVGIYHEEWGIGFRLEDNCLITPDGCENLSAVTPRSIEDIEAFMGKRNIRIPAVPGADLP